EEDRLGVINHGFGVFEVVRGLRFDLLGEQDLRASGEAHLMPFLNCSQTRARKLEIRLGRAHAGSRRGEDIEALFDIEDDVLDRAAKSEVCGDELLSGAAFRGTSPAEIEEV